MRTPHFSLLRDFGGEVLGTPSERGMYAIPQSPEAKGFVCSRREEKVTLFPFAPDDLDTQFEALPIGSPKEIQFLAMELEGVKV